MASAVMNSPPCDGFSIKIVVGHSTPKRKTGPPKALVQRLKNSSAAQSSGDNKRSSKPDQAAARREMIAQARAAQRALRYQRRMKVLEMLDNVVKYEAAKQKLDEQLQLHAERRAAEVEKTKLKAEKLGNEAVESAKARREERKNERSQKLERSLEVAQERRDRFLKSRSDTAKLAKFKNFYRPSSASSPPSSAEASPQESPREQPKSPSAVKVAKDKAHVVVDRHSVTVARVTAERETQKKELMDRIEKQLSQAVEVRTAALSGTRSYLREKADDKKTRAAARKAATDEGVRELAERMESNQTKAAERRKSFKAGDKGYCPGQCFKHMPKASPAEVA